MRPSMLAVLAAVSLSACGTMTLPETSTIEQASIEAVIRNLKDQVDAYQRMVYEEQQKAKARGTAPKNTLACGGEVRIAITQITVKLTTTLVKAGSASIGAGIPTGGQTIGVAFGGSRSVTNSQQLTFPLYPVLLDDPAAVKVDKNNMPIADALLSLQQALQQNVNPGTCFNLYDAKGIKIGKGGRYTLGLNVRKQSQAGVSLGLSTVKLDASGSATSTSGNTVTVTFQQIALGKRKNSTPPPVRGTGNGPSVPPAPRPVLPTRTFKLDQQLMQGIAIDRALIDQKTE